MIEIKFPTVMEFSYESDKKTKKKVKFERFDAKVNTLYYSFDFDGKTYEFPIKGDDEIKGAIWNAEDYAPMFRRHYSKALKSDDIRVV